MNTILRSNQLLTSTICFLVMYVNLQPSKYCNTFSTVYYQGWFTFRLTKNTCWVFGKLKVYRSTITKIYVSLFESIMVSSFTPYSRPHVLYSKSHRLFNRWNIWGKNCCRNRFCENEFWGVLQISWSDGATFQWFLSW